MRALPFGYYTDVTPLQDVGEFISDPVRNSAVQSEAFGASDKVPRILAYRDWRAGGEKCDRSKRGSPYGEGEGGLRVDLLPYSRDWVNSRIQETESVRLGHPSEPQGRASR